MLNRQCLIVCLFCKFILKILFPCHSSYMQMCNWYTCHHLSQTIEERVIDVEQPPFLKNAYPKTVQLIQAPLYAYKIDYLRSKKIISGSSKIRKLPQMAPLIIIDGFQSLLWDNTWKFQILWFLMDSYHLDGLQICKSLTICHWLRATIRFITLAQKHPSKTPLQLARSLSA